MRLFQLISYISIRTKLAIVFSIVLGIIAIFMYYFLPGRLGTQNYQSLHEKTESIALLTSHSVTAALVFGDSLAATRVLEITSQDTSIAYIVVKDASGRVFASYRLHVAEQYRYEDEQEVATTPWDGDIISISTPITHNERIVGQLYIGMSLTELRQYIDTSRLTILILVLLVFLFGFLVVYVLTFLIVQPLTSMVDTVGRIKGGDMNQRAAIVSNDEVGQLAGAFNEMVEHLSLAQQQLKEANENLESRVIERTQQLSQSEEALRQTGEQLRALSVHLQSIREEERAYISREIHDQMGQMLTAMNIDLAIVEKQLTKADPVLGMTPLIEKVRYISAMVESTIHRMRRLALELRPDVLDKLGLVEAIEWQVNEFEARTRIRCDLLIQASSASFDEQNAIALFRMLQEALTNITRHAHATRVEIRLREQKSKIVLEVRDNGKGISESDLKGVRSLGIIGMRERAAHLGGHVRIEGKPGAGTTVRVEIPLKEEKTAGSSETPASPVD